MPKKIHFTPIYTEAKRYWKVIHYTNVGSFDLRGLLSNTL